jgi:hypothetical protein
LVAWRSIFTDDTTRTSFYMSRKNRSKKKNPATTKGGSMDTIEGRVTYGPGYEDQNQEGLETETGANADVASASSSEDTAQGALSSAADTAQEITSTVVETAGDVVSSASETVQQAATAVVDTAKQATSTVTGAVTDKVDQVSDAAASKIEQLADTMAEVPYSGDAPRLQRQVADTTVNVLDRTAEYLRTGDTDVILEDLRAMVRRHPLRSLAIGLGLGYLARGVLFPSSGGQQSARARTVPRSAPLAPPAPVSVETSIGGYDTTRSAGISSTATIGTGSPALGSDVMGGSSLDTISGLGTSGAFDDLATTTGASGTAIGPDFDAGLTTMPDTISGLGFGSSLVDRDIPDDRSSSLSGLETDVIGGTTDFTTGDVSGDVSTTTGEQFNMSGQEGATDPADSAPHSDDPLPNWDGSTRGTSS